MSIPYQRWRDGYVLFLDDAFDCDETYECLVDAGYEVQRFSRHFVGPDGSRKQGIDDEQVLRLCNRHGWILVTTDSNIVRMHLNVVKECTHLGILATAHNREQDITAWAKSLCRLKLCIERNNFRKRQRPWYGQFDRNGRLTKIGTVG